MFEVNSRSRVSAVRAKKPSREAVNLRGEAGQTNLAPLWFGDATVELTARPGDDACPQIVAYHLPGHDSEKGKCPNVRGDPVRQALAEAAFGVGVVRGVMLSASNLTYAQATWTQGRPTGSAHVGTFAATGGVPALLVADKNTKVAVVEARL